MEDILVLSRLYQFYIPGMKTKYVRFNKLPKLEGSQREKDFREPMQSQHNSRNTINANRRSDSVMGFTMAELFEQFMRKNSKGTPGYELEPRDRSVLLELPDAVQQEEMDDQILTQWITEVCSNVFSSAFNSLEQDLMSYEQSKIFCSEGILKNIVQLTRKFRLNERQIKLIDRHIAKSVIPYMKKKYPMTETSDSNKALDEQVSPIDNRQALENDLLLKCQDVVFAYRQSGNYNDLIMRFLNWVMEEMDEKEQNSRYTPYQEFDKYMSTLFEMVHDQAWMNKRQAESHKLIDERSLQFIQDPPEDRLINQKYEAQVREYTHYAIGRKISKNVETYTEEEINSGHLTIKSPSILRILTKWTDELWDKFKVKNYFLNRSENLKVQGKNGNVNTMFTWMKIPLNDLIEEEKGNVEAFIKQLENNVYDQHARLLIKQLQHDGFTHIDKLEKAAGKYSTKTVNNLHTYIVICLNRVIHGLLRVAKRLWETKLSTKARWKAPPNLLSFKLSDLMRCKCHSKERQILRIYQEMDRISDSNKQDMFKIYRVKNRLKTGSNDILINVLFKKKYLCEVQLGVNASTSKWIKCSNKFNHYIYELGRSLFGPLTELSSVWMSLDPRADSYKAIIKKEKRTPNYQSNACISDELEHHYSELRRPFICTNCGLAFSHANYIWSHKQCMRQGCQHKICAYCRLDSQKEEDLKEKVFENQQQDLKNACTGIVNRKKEIDRHIPEYGVCILMTSNQVKVVKFKKLEIQKIQTVYSLRQKGDKEVIEKMMEVVEVNDEVKFFRKYLVFEIPKQKGQQLIDITIDKAKKEYILPQKIKKAYKTEKELISLIEENLDDQSIRMLKGPRSKMRELETLELADNKLTNIEFICEHLVNLKRLQLSRNQLVNVDGVGRLARLTKLNIRNNKLTSLPDELCELRQLRGINIRSNAISKLPQQFGNLNLMQKIEGDNNRITQLPESFANLKQLQFVDFSKNSLNQFPKQLQQLSKLEHIALSHNNLGELPEWIGYLKQLHTLNLSQTSLNNFPITIYSMNQLKNFKIQSSQPSLMPYIKNLDNLESLTLQMANLKDIPNQIVQLPKLQELGLTDCYLPEVPEFLTQIDNLNTLSLVNNGLTGLNDILPQLKSLTNLSIEKQRIKELPPSMESMTQLKTLSIDGNQFEQLPELIGNYVHLYSLSFRSNQITAINEYFFCDLLAIQNLLMDNNKLQSLPKTIKLLNNVKKFSFKGNPIESVPEWVQDVLNSPNKVLTLEDPPRTTSAISYRGKRKKKQ